MRFIRRRRAEVEVNLTPLIDVVLLLPIFCMVSTTFIKEAHISIDLPKASGDLARISEKRIEISITRSGEFAINKVALIRSDLATLKAAIAKVSGGNNAMPMIITADAATTHQSVVTVMDAAGQLGFVHLSITTKNTTVDGD